MRKFMGGFFEMALPETFPQKSIAAHWGLPEDPTLRFTNARSALATLFSALQPERVWVPSYICSSVIDAFTKSGTSIRYYAVNDILEPDVVMLQQETRADDSVLAINYFGRSPNTAFREFVNKRRDLIFIEDCAQTIDSGSSVWGNYRLMSPRKVVGVADGGYIIPAEHTQHSTLSPSLACGTEAQRWTASLSRFEDKEECHNVRWHAAHQEQEKSMRVSDARMSLLSHELLKYMDVSTIIEQRKRNFSALYAQLSDIAFLTIASPSFCPFGFPVRLSADLRTHVYHELIAMGLFPAIHWETLPSPAKQFSKEHQLSKEILTLPCDQRYSVSDMAYLAQSVRAILRVRL